MKLLNIISVILVLIGLAMFPLMHHNPLNIKKITFEKVEDKTCDSGYKDLIRFYYKDNTTVDVDSELLVIISILVFFILVKIVFKISQRRNL